MKIAVTGASGFVGSHLLRALSENHDVTVLYHSSKSKYTFSKRVKTVKGSLADMKSLRNAFKDADVVFHLVGIIAETRNKTFRKTVVSGTENVVKACRDMNVKKIIYISALGAEENAATKYHQTKFKAERLIIRSGIEYVILRPSIIYGEHDGFVSMLTKQIKFMPFTPIIGTGKYLFQPVYIDDLMLVMIKSIESLTAINKIIEIGGAEQLEFIEIINILKKRLQKKRLNFYIPIALMKLIAGLLEIIIKPAPVTVDQLVMLEAGSTCDIKMMKEIYSIEPLRFEDGIKIYLR